MKINLLKKFVSVLIIISLLFSFNIQDKKTVYAYDGDVIDWLFDMAKTHNLIAESNRIWSEVSNMPSGVGILDIIRGMDYAKTVVSKRLNDLTIDVSNGIDAVRNTFNSLSDENKSNIINLYEQYYNTNVVITNEIYNNLNLHLFDEILRDKNILYYNNSPFLYDGYVNHRTVYTSPGYLPTYLRDYDTVLNASEKASMGVGGSFWSGHLTASSTAYTRMERLYLITCTGLDRSENAKFVSSELINGYTTSCYVANSIFIGSSNPVEIDRVSFIFTWSSQSQSNELYKGYPVKFFLGYPALIYNNLLYGSSKNSLILKFTSSNGSKVHTDFSRILRFDGSVVTTNTTGFSYETKHPEESVNSNVFAYKYGNSSHYFLGGALPFNATVTEFVLDASYGASFYYDDGSTLYNNNEYIENIYNYNYYVTNNYYNDSNNTDCYNYIPSSNDNYYDYSTNNEYVETINNYINNNFYKDNSTTIINNYYQINNYIEPTPSPTPTPTPNEDMEELINSLIDEMDYLRISLIEAINKNGSDVGQKIDGNGNDINLSLEALRISLEKNHDELVTLLGTNFKKLNDNEITEINLLDELLNLIRELPIGEGTVTNNYYYGSNGGDEDDPGGTSDTDIMLLVSKIDEFKDSMTDAASNNGKKIDTVNTTIKSLQELLLENFKNLDERFSGAVIVLFLILSIATIMFILWICSQVWRAIWSHIVQVWL